MSLNEGVISARGRGRSEAGLQTCRSRRASLCAEASAREGCFARDAGFARHAASCEFEGARCFRTWMVSSSRSTARFPGMKPAPMPWILWGPGGPPLMTGDSVGSTAITWGHIGNTPRSQQPDQCNPRWRLEKAFHEVRLTMTCVSPRVSGARLVWPRDKLQARERRSGSR